MIESGSHTPGVSPQDFGLPAGTALRYEMPDPALGPFLADYHVYDSEGPEAEQAVNWLLPGMPTIDIILAERPISLTLGSRRYDPLPVAALYGSTSRAMKMVTSGGATVGATLTPLGWARLFRTSAHDLRDRVVPLQQLMDPSRVDALVSALRGGLDAGRGAKRVLDAFFHEALGPADPNEPSIRALMSLIADDAVRDIAGAADAIGIAPAHLRRLAKRYFGFPPKTLLVRTRFLRSFLAMMSARDQPDYGRVAPSYHDASHFLRDANRFLGMTPRRFMNMQTDYLDAALHARRLVIHAARTERSARKAA